MTSSAEWPVHFHIKLPPAPPLDVDLRRVFHAGISQVRVTFFGYRRSIITLT